MKRVAQRVVEERCRDNQVVVVLSAMGDTTDDLVDLAHQVCKEPPQREMDMLLSVGERMSIALLAMAITDLGYQAMSFTGSQIGIITDNRHTDARILEVRGLRIQEALDSGKIVVVAGFQGVSVDKEITTLGRGGSDTTALALAAALNAERCEIMKDVDGVYIAEPRIIPQPKMNSEISYDEMIEMANMGAGVLKTESVEIARHYGVKVAVGSSFTGKVGTIITERPHDTSAISGIVKQSGMLYVKTELPTLNEKNRFNQLMADHRIKVQAYAFQPGSVELVCQKRFLADIRRIVRGINRKEPELSLYSESVGIIAIIGTGLNFNSETALRIFEAVERLKLEPRMLQISELRISWIMEEDRVDQTVQHLYRELIPEEASASEQH
ncbi:MAG: aspartate kinase [candidate division Zixibacteria bacterium]|nr:aspartate kinase [candidate division KSB1 bacterium]NIV08324.1 aspartate kinase [candidate division Zixibacteria bacterium]NIW72038.1 aspartate kinase [candidate division KSB1 bacterium]